MILLQAQQIERRFGADVLFTNVQLEIQEHARVALVGRNGAGKSTLLKILANLEAPDEGTVTTKKELTLSYLAQNSGLNSNNTIWEEMLAVFDNVRNLEKQMHTLEAQIADPSAFEPTEYEQLLTRYDQLQHDFNMLNGYGYEASIRGVLHGFNFAPERFDSPISSLSGGQRTRLALAKALLEKPDLLILDEPTNHLDMNTLAWLESYLQNYTGALLLVSHDRYFLDRVVTEVYDMNFGHLDHYHGNYSKFLEIKAERLKTEMRAYTKQQKKSKNLKTLLIVILFVLQQLNERNHAVNNLNGWKRLLSPSMMLHGLKCSFQPTLKVVMKSCVSVMLVSVTMPLKYWPTQLIWMSTKTMPWQLLGPMGLVNQPYLKVFSISFPF